MPMTARRARRRRFIMRFPSTRQMRRRWPDWRSTGSALVSVRSNLDAAVIRPVEIQLVATARPVRGVPVDGGVDPHFFQSGCNPFGIVIVNADADVIHGAGVCQLVNTEKSVTQAEIDATVARPAHDLQSENFG